MSNFTVDDTAVTLVYGPGWGVQSPTDSTLDEYFQSTYHASETTGADVNLTFSGTAIYLYGSKGPDHSTFSVRHDTLVVEGLSAIADTPQYMQLLFSTTLTGPLNGSHLLTLTNTGGGSGRNWLDLDFITVTTNDASSSSAPPAGSFSSTISPLPPHSTSTPSPTPARATATTTTTVSSPTGTTLILAIVFGILLFFLLLAVSFYLLRRRCRRHPTARSAPRPMSTAGLVPIPESTRSAGSAFLAPQEVSLQHHTIAVSPLASHTTSGRSQPTSNPYSTFSGTETEGDHIHTHTASTSSPTSSGVVVRPWSPFATPIKALFGGRPPGADSMKSTFLKV